VRGIHDELMVTRGDTIHRASLVVLGASMHHRIEVLPIIMPHRISKYFILRSLKNLWMTDSP
jgi:hypothetical protein